jgi:murein peptide amidase A
MRALIPTHRTPTPTAPGTLDNQPCVTQQLLAPLLNLAKTSDYLVADSIGDFVVGEKTFSIPRFIFMGPKGGGDSIRLGIFATIHGDEPEGADAVVSFLKDLEREPELAKGYHLYVYPICNPTGYAAYTRHNSSGQELSRHFWRRSDQPEVYYLEREMGVFHFHGVLSLHSSRNVKALSADTRSSTIQSSVAQPAIEAAANVFSGFQSAITGKTSPSSEPESPAPNLKGFLTTTDELSPVPFEVNLTTPRQAPRHLQVWSMVSALKSILESYRSLMAIRQNI